MQHRRSVTLVAIATAYVCLALISADAGGPLKAQQADTGSTLGAATDLPRPIQDKLDQVENAIKAARTAGDAKAEANALNSSGDAYLNISELGKALDAYAQALVKARAAKDAVAEAAALNGTAACYFSQNQAEKAAMNFKQVLDITKASGDLLGQATAIDGIGWLSGAVGDWQGALKMHQRALTMARNLGSKSIEAKALLGMGIAYGYLGSLQEAKQNGVQALELFQEIGDKEDEANTYGQFAVGYRNLKDPDHAMQFALKAVLAYRESGDRKKQAAVLRQIGLGYMALGQPPKALLSFNQALGLARAIGDHSEESMALNGVGLVYLARGEKKKVLETYGESLAIARSAGDEEGEANGLNLVGAAYQELGDRRKAIENFNQALVLFKGKGDLDGEASALNNLGMAHGALGEGQQALNFYEQAATLYQQAHDTNGAGTAMNNIGTVHLALGDLQKAIEYFNLGLPLFQQASNKYAANVALTNIGFCYVKLNEWQKSLDSLQQALTLESAIGDQPREGFTLTIMGFAYSGLGQKQKALDALNQALPINREVGTPEIEGLNLEKLGAVYHDLGQEEKAQDFLKQALAKATEVGNPLLQSMILNDLMLSLKASRPMMAIFYGKRGINLLQQLRANIQGMDKALQAGFLLSKEDFYHDLADLLIAQSRLPEAQQVLDLLKQQEYSDYTRGEATDTMRPLTLTPSEQQAEQDYQKSTAQIVALGNEWSELRKITARSPEQEARYKEVSDQIKVANSGLSEYYKRLYVVFGTGSSANERIADVTGRVNLLNQVLAKTPHTVALYTLVGKDRYRVIVISGGAQVAREYPISEEDLNKKVAAFEQVLRNRASDPRPAAKELYDILIGPVKKDLDLAHAETLVWSLDGSLRYVPTAALFDGEKYLVEKYNTVTITPVSIQYLAEKPDVSNLSAAAMGISRKYEDKLPELKAVVGELDEVVKDPQVQGANGVLPGTLLLDNRFTEKAMEDQLSGQHSVVHIASHFVFNPGDDKQSYLLLAEKDESGKAFHLTVDEFHHNPNLSLTDTTLLTLSACETGMSGIASNGREVDGLGTTAVAKGAKAVISTLWEVDDASTGELMADFYRRWASGEGKVQKVEALRQAQLDLLLGKNPMPSGSQNDTSHRGLAAAENEAPRPQRFAHPYYWAPFVLMGNWK